MEHIKNVFSQIFARSALSLLFVVASIMVIFMPERTMKSMRQALKEW